MEAHGFHLSKSKMEYMEHKFNKKHTNTRLEVKIGGHTTIPQFKWFRYHGFTIQNKEEIDGEVNHRI